MDYEKSVELLENGRASDCVDFFKSGNYSLEYAYALLLLGEIKLAEITVEPLDSVRADWLKKVISIINGYVEYPSYFQLRNFLEIDITMFIKSQKIDYVNSLLKLADIFQGINSESYKFFARVLLKNDYPSECKIFLDKSADSYFNDVELHYLYAEYYLYVNDKEQAKKSAQTCLRINPEYYPAKKLVSDS